MTIAPPLEQALATPGPHVAAWDYASDPKAGLGVAVYAVSASGATRVGFAKVPAAERDATTAALRERGARIGGIYGGAPIVWVCDDEGLAVWSDAALAASGTRAEPVTGVRAAEVAAVVSTIDKRLVRRAVELELKSGKRAVVAEEQDEIARLDPTYGDSELAMSSAYWVTYLGRELASWLRVPHRDEVFDLALDFALVSALAEIGDRIEQAPAAGAFAPVTIDFETAKGVKGQLHFAPSPTVPERFVEMRVLSASGQSNASRWLANGSNAELLTYLRRPDRLDRFAKTLRELGESLQRSELA